MIKPKVILEKSVHRESAVIKILFEKNNEIQVCLSPLPGLRWSQTMRCWYVPHSNSVVQDVFRLINPVAYLDYSQIHADVPILQTALESANLKVRKEPSSATAHLPSLTDEKRLKVDGFSAWMRSRRYSESTVVTYTDALSVFLRYFQAKEIGHITNEDLVDFNNQFILENKLSASYQNQVINAVKLFFRTIQMRSMDIELVHRPKRAKLLPNVLSKEEVKSLLTAPVNIKHRAMLSLIYSCGLRCGELLRLKFEHLDSKRSLLLIKQSKGKKDRIVPLSKKTIEVLRDYYKAFSPKVFLFEGQAEGTMYDERSLQQVLKQNLLKAGITKPVTLHWLRHSYATHLLESGTDLRYIQEILGHSRSTTTEIYTHVSTRSIQNVISPFDDL